MNKPKRATPGASAANNNSNNQWQGHRAQPNRHRPGHPRYANHTHEPDRSVRPSPQDRLSNLSPPPSSSQPTFLKGFLFSNLPPFSTQLHVHERAFLPYQSCTPGPATSASRSPFANEVFPTNQPPVARQAPYTDPYPSTRQSRSSKPSLHLQILSFNDTAPLQQFIPARPLAVPHPSKPVLRTQSSSSSSSSTQAEMAAFRAAMLRVPRNEQERREQDALLEAELDKVE